MARRKTQSDVTRSGHKPDSQRILQSVTISNSHHSYQNHDHVCHLGRSRAIFRLGQIEDYWIYRSDLPQSGHFNLLLVIKFASTADLAPNKERYDTFIEAWGQANADASTDYAQKNYPGIRKITGNYMMGEVTLK